MALTELLCQRHTAAHPILRAEPDQAAYNHGLRKANRVADGWPWSKSDADMPGQLALASGINFDRSPWVMMIQHTGVAAKLSGELVSSTINPSAHFRSAFAIETQTQLRAALSRASHLARSLPTFPLVQYEADRTVEQRVGQDYLRGAVLN